MGKGLCCSGHIKVQNFRNQLGFQPTPQFFIYAEMRHTVFVIYRMDQSRNSSTGGYGLGMSIAQSIVAVHKGKIRAECPGENVLMISVTLPL